MTPLSSLVSADIFLNIPPPLTRDSSPDPTASSSHGASPQRPGKPPVQETILNVVFFITGNPGLITYYRPFLSLLAEGLEKRDSPRKQAVVAGFSLGGFEVDGDGHARTAKQDPKGENEAEDAEDGVPAVEDLLYPQPHQHHENRLYTLRDQIELNYDRLEKLISRLRRDDNHDPSAAALGPDAEEEQKCGECSPPSATSSVRFKVILIGHSVGAYIALELVRLWHERHQRQAQPLQTEAVPWPWTISSCILLTPTIVDIHASPSGKLATPLLTSIPLFSALLPTLTHTLLRSVLVPALPSTWLRRLVQRATGMRVGSHGLEATMKFLLSPRGVRQALVMASAEMREIRADTWGDEVWGVSRGGMTEAAEGTKPGTGTAPNLYFWFARSDHWVADITREKILQSRGGVVEDRHDMVAGTDEIRVLDEGRGNPSGQKKPLIYIDETDGLVHAWCLDQSRLVAARVGVWLDEILDQDD